jgi:hypothetical protein
VAITVLSFSFGWTQNTKIKGVVIDSSSVPMVSATVVLIQPLDSAMVSYALTNEKGGFIMTNIPNGTYHLQITYIGYGNFRQLIEVDGSAPEQDLGIIFLSSKNSLLDEVIVKAEHVPIAFNGDTLEYNAAAFRTQANAPVEDLLKKLPGVTVNRDGSIRAQGEDVDNVLVDGKSFFGDDATIATKNLPADIVDKVQVFDKASDLSTFSGIDDGNDEKTINLSLKEDKKNGYFGSLEGGIGQDDPANEFDATRYRGKGNLHRFDNKLQLSALAMANNNNDRGFSFNDYINFMGGMGNFLRGGSAGLSFDQSQMGIPLGHNNTPGITDTYAGGINFNYNPSEKFDWQSSYFINQIDNHVLGRSSSQNLDGVQSFLKRDSSDRNNHNLNHRLNSALKYELDSSFQLTWNNRLSYNSGRIDDKSNSRSFEPGAISETSSKTHYDDKGFQFNWNTNLSLRKRLNKPGRMVSGNMDYSHRIDDLDAHIENDVSIVGKDHTEYTEMVLQDQTSAEDAQIYSLGLNYTEPIGKRTFLNFGVNRNNDNSERQRRYFDIDPNNPTSRVFNDQLSNQYSAIYNNNRLTTGLRYVGKSLNLSVGLDYQQAELDGQNISESNALDRQFDRFLPRFRLDYETGRNRNFELNYFSRMVAPRLEQLQPLLNNSNPVYVFQGNPSLEPEYMHLVDLNYMLFDEFSFTNLFVNLRGRYTENKIVNQTSLDSTFRQLVVPDNTDNSLGANLYFNFETPLKFIKSKVALDAYIDYERGLFSVNGIENTTDRWTQNVTLTLENRKKEIVDIAIGASLGTSQVNYSESSSFDQSYFDQRYFTDFTINLPNHWIVSSQMDYTHYSDEIFGSSDELYLWSAKISKSFMENQRATLTLSAFDILNQNRGIERNNSLNYVQESRSNVLGRYVMLSFTYKVSQFGSNGGFNVEVN